MSYLQYEISIKIAFWLKWEYYSRSTRLTNWFLDLLPRIDLRTSIDIYRTIKWFFLLNFKDTHKKNDIFHLYSLFSQFVLVVLLTKYQVYFVHLYKSDYQSKTKQKKLNILKGLEYKPFDEYEQFSIGFLLSMYQFSIELEDALVDQ